MSHAHNQPETPGAGHHSQTPQVAVRDGNRLICPCCGEVLMILVEQPKSEPPPEPPPVPLPSQPKQKKFYFPPRSGTKGDPRRTCPALEEMIRRQEEAAYGPKPEPPPKLPAALPVIDDGPHYCADAIAVEIDPEIAAHTFPEAAPPPVYPLRKPRRDRSDEYRAPRERDPDAKYREQELRRMKLPPGEPFTYKLARLYAWTYYRLQKLDLQLQGEICAKQEEIERLKQELEARSRRAGVDGVSPQHETPATMRPSGEAYAPTYQAHETQSNVAPHRSASELPAVAPHAQEDLGVAPGFDARTHRAGVNEVPSQHETLATMRPSGEAQSNAAPRRSASELPTVAPHAQEDLGVAPGVVVHAVSVASVDVGSFKTVSPPALELASNTQEAHERGPP